MDEKTGVLIFVGIVILACGALGVITKWNIDRKRKPHKKLSKKQKREQGIE